MSATTELSRVVANLNYPDGLPVLVSEERESAHCLSFVFGGHGGAHLAVCHQADIHFGFYVSKLFRCDLSEMGEVEPETARLDK